MKTTLPMQVTKKGLLIPRDVLGDLDVDELEAVREGAAIIIRPKLVHADERSRVREVLKAAGMLYEPDWEEPASVSPEERARLAWELGQAGPLSEVIIADREGR